MAQEGIKNKTLRRASAKGCEYSIVDKNGVEYLYAVVSASDVVGNFRDQTIEAFRRLENLLESEDCVGLVKLNVFLRNVGDKQLVRALAARFFGSQVPATTYIPQTPCDPNAVLKLEATAIRLDENGGAELNFDGDEDGAENPALGVSIEYCGENATLVQYADVALGFFGGFGPGAEPVGAYERSFDAFVKMRAEVESNGFLTPQIFRTWIYQGRIVLPEGENDETQRYKELNRARSDFFYGTRFLEEYLPKNAPFGAVYPASTGIGADDVDVALSCQTINTDRADCVVAPLENPNQTPAFDYAEFYSPKSPKFSRAVAVKFNERCAVYVSGTASIVDQETVFIGDPVGQTNQTLDNIAALISGSNLKKYGVDGFDAELSDLAVARVYVKRREDEAAIRAVCEKRLAGVPTIYTFADVCRDDLLVEIEGIVACNPTAE